MSGNPFRRARGDRIPDYDRPLRNDENDAPRRSNPLSRKKKKVVTIQTPPQSPEEAPRRLSAGRTSPPPPPRTPEDDEESSDSTATADSELEQAVRNTRRNSGSLATPTALAAGAGGGGGGGAPYNPFARTLATSEAAFGLQRTTNGQQEDNGRPEENGNKQGGSGQPAMDVDQFKNILMTGSAVPSPVPTSAPTTAPQPSRFQDSSSNTDASSTSRQSLFDPYFELNQETPRTSFDDQVDSPSESSDGDDEERSGLMSGPTRLDDFAPPAPPKQSSGRPAAVKGPQTVSFSDFDEQITEGSRTRVPPVSINTTGLMRPPPTLHRSPSDLNKPLPPPPAEPLGTRMVDDSKADGSASSTLYAPTIATTVESAETKKAPPPPPPASRRVGQPGTAQTRARSSSNGTQSSLHDDSTTGQQKVVDSNTRSAAPPPPPTRKSKASQQPATAGTETPPAIPSPGLAPNLDLAPTETAKNIPAPPPRRMASKAGNSAVRTPSNASRVSVQRKEASSTTAVTGVPAPPAPPPRRKRESAEIAQRAASDETAQAPSNDILADLTAFQAEIDALRAKAAEGSG